VPSKDPVLLETRTISGKGLFVIPPNDNYRHFYLYVSVIRRPPVNFINSKYNPDKSEYAKMVWLRKDYVLKESVVNYEQSLFEYPVDITGYLCNGIVCGFNGISNYLSYICAALGIPPLQAGLDDTIYTQPLSNSPDAVKIVCRSSAALQCKLYYLEYDNNCQQFSPNPKPPPDPLPQPPILDGLPIDTISPPYDLPDDAGDTEPYPDDTIPPIPDPPGGCWKTYTTYNSSSYPPTTDYTYGLSSDNPALRLPEGAITWELYDQNTGRTMRTGWVGYQVIPTLVSKIWQPVCESEEIYGNQP